MLSLHSLTSFIYSDFIILNEENFNSKELFKTIRSAHPKKVFLKKASEIYYIQNLETFGQLSYQWCKKIYLTNNIDNIISQQNVSSFIAVLDEAEKFTGYIYLSELCQYLYNNYQRMNAFIHTILDTTDESFTVIDKAKNVIFWTKGAEQLFSVKQQDILGKPITNFFEHDHLEVLNTLKGSAVYHKQHKARENQVVLINSNPVYLKDDIIGAVVSESDITNQIRLNNELYNTTSKLFNLEKEVTKLTANEDPFQAIRGGSPLLKETIQKVSKAATTDANILIQGESGVGKELFAKAAHNLREKKEAPFIAINCGAIPDSLFESEMFGYERGAFSGANQKGKKGKVELAKNGTLFLDEIGEMPLDMQVKLLRLLQEKNFYRVGGTEEVKVDFRVIAATNKNLHKLVEEHNFREDLFYRLHVVNIEIPPLRKRPEDIIELTHYFLYEVSIKYNQPIHGISQSIMQALLQHDWPGNIRELQNVIERLVVFSDHGEMNLTDIPFEVDETKKKRNGQLNTSQDDVRSLNERLLDLEKNILKQELEKTKGNKQQCAKNLQITRATLYNRLKKVGLE